MSKTRNYTTSGIPKIDLPYSHSEISRDLLYASTDFLNLPKLEYILPICVRIESRRGSSSFKPSITSFNCHHMNMHKKVKKRRIKIKRGEGLSGK